MNEVRRLLNQQPQAHDPRDPHFDDNAGVLVVERDPDTRSIVSVKRFDDVDDVRVSAISFVVVVALICALEMQTVRLTYATGMCRHKSRTRIL